jgi:hypothetical protein
MRRAVPLCAEVDVLLCAGQVAAWRAGMAHYRPGALELLKTLDAPLARTIFGLDANALAPDTGALCEALLSNPWHDPANASSGERALQLVRRVGAFRGFGGSFLTPPRVVWTGAGFVATDEQESYLIHADAFGATLHRTGESKMQRVSSPFQLSPAGEVTREELKTTFPVLAKATSSAANQNTLAVTTEFTHSIFFIAVIE